MPRTSPLSFRRCSVKPAFTLVELMIVVVILGILAAIVVPQFTSASQTTRQNTLREDLQNLRMQIGLFKAQHCEVAPGYAAGSRNSPSESSFIAQMTQFSAQDGTSSAGFTTVFQFGPYLARVPENPILGQAGVLIIEDGQPMPDPSTFPVMNGQSPYGWIYKPQTQQIMANLSGSDFNGVAYSSY